MDDEAVKELAMLQGIGAGGDELATAGKDKSREDSTVRSEISGCDDTAYGERYQGESEIDTAI